MRKILFGLAKRMLPFFLLPPALAFAQFTTVTGTVVDPDGVPYGQGTVLPILSYSGGTPMFNGVPYIPPSQATGLDNVGHFIVNVAANASISPGGSQWNFLVCSARGTVAPAFGKGPVCFTLAAPITISGSTQDISTQLNAVALALTYATTGGGGPPTGPAGGVLSGTYPNPGFANSVNLPGAPTAATAATGTNTTQLATTAFVLAQIPLSSPCPGSAASGSVLYNNAGACGGLTGITEVGGVFTTATLTDNSATDTMVLESIWNPSANVGAPPANFIWANGEFFANFTTDQTSPVGGLIGQGQQTSGGTGGNVIFGTGGRVNLAGSGLTGYNLWAIRNQGGGTWTNSIGLGIDMMAGVSGTTNTAQIWLKNGNASANVFPGSGNFGIYQGTAALNEPNFIGQPTTFGNDIIGVETTAPSGIASSDVLWADSTAHRWKMNNNNAGALNLVGIASAATSGHVAAFASNGIDIVDGGAAGSLPSGTQGQPLINTSGSTSYATSGVFLDASQFTGADWGAKLAACIAALPAAGGTCDGRALATGSTSTNPFASYTVPVSVIFAPGTYTSTVNWVFNATTFGTALKQAAVRIAGSAGTCGDDSQSTCPVTGTIIDFTAASGVSHIDSKGYGNLEIDHLVIEDDSGGTVPFLQDTCTAMSIHDNSFIGSAAGLSANQDVFILGASGGTDSSCTDTTSSFQGYLTVIDHNFFSRVRRWVVGGNNANGVVISNNYTGFGSFAAGNIAGGAIEFVATNTAGNDITGNIFEMADYAYGVWIKNNNKASITNNGFYDSSDGTRIVTAASCTSTTETVTLSVSNTLAVGQIVSISGISPGAWNSTGAVLTGVNPSGPSTASFTVASCPGSAYVSGGQLNYTAAAVALGANTQVTVTGNYYDSVFVTDDQSANNYTNFVAFNSNPSLTSTPSYISGGNTVLLGLGTKTPVNNFDVYGAIGVGATIAGISAAPTGAAIYADRALMANTGTLPTLAGSNAELAVGNRLWVFGEGGNGIPTNPFLAPVAAVEMTTGRDENGDNLGHPMDLAIQCGYGCGSGYRFFMETTHSGTVAKNKWNFWVNNSASGTTSTAPGTGNVLGLTIGPGNITSPVVISPESTAPSGISGSDILYADSSLHQWVAINNSGSATPLAFANAASQYALPYYSATGSASQLSGLAPQTANGLYSLVENVTGGVAVAPTLALAGVPVNAQTGTSYTFLYSDRGNLVTFSNASATAVTLPQAGSTGFGSNFRMEVLNKGAGLVTITPTTSTISLNGNTGAATLVLQQGQWALISSDNTNYLADSPVPYFNGILSLPGATSGKFSITPPAVAGTSTNGATVSNVLLGVDGSAAAPTYSFTSQPSSGFFLLSGNAHFSRQGVDTVIFGSAVLDPSATNTSSLGDATHVWTTVNIDAVMVRGTTFTSNAGCSETSLTGGATAGRFTTGVSTPCTTIITMGNSATAANGWACYANDQTSIPTTAIRQTASSTTTASFLMTVTTSDVINFACTGY